MHRLPASLEHMLAFIYLAYSMMALLHETVPASEFSLSYTSLFRLLSESTSTSS